MASLRVLHLVPVCVFGPIKNENGDETEKLRKKSPVRISKTTSFDRTTFWANSLARAVDQTMFLKPVLWANHLCKIIDQVSLVSYIRRGYSIEVESIY